MFMCTQSTANMRAGSSIGPPVELCVLLTLQLGGPSPTNLLERGVTTAAYIGHVHAVAHSLAEKI